MDFSTIDKILNDWAKKYGLFIYTQYKDCEVRSIDVVDDLGGTYQIWLDITPDAQIIINCWDKKKQKKEFTCSYDKLGICLEKAYSTVEQWICKLNRKRTIY